MNRFFFLFFFLLNTAWAQTAFFQGTIVNQGGQPIPSALVRSNQVQVLSDEHGRFQLPYAGGSLRIQIQHLAYYSLDTLLSNEQAALETRFTLTERERFLKEVVVRSRKPSEETFRDQAGLTRVNARTAESMPSPFGDISGLLASLPGVIQSNELSTAYTVRGGNFDENLVYVNDIPVYRPFLVRAGRQEGLSFVNPYLVERLSFSAGGWQAKYGDKLSSVMNVQYKKPDSLEAAANLSLLGGSAYLGGKSKKGLFTYLAGFRHKSAQYLLNTLDTEGEYLPRFSDFQSFFTYQPGPNSEFGLLLSYARNRYIVRPQSRQTSFGTLQQPFRLSIDLQGRELMQYDLGQEALYYRFKPTDQHEGTVLLSYVDTREREYVDLDSWYQLCNIDMDPDSDQYKECLSILGTGSEYRNIRNELRARIATLQYRHVWNPVEQHTLEAGVQLDRERISDRLQEWSYADSAGFSLLDFNQSVFNALSLQSWRTQLYLQGTSYLSGGRHSLTYGMRTQHWSQNNEWLISPRLQYAYRPNWLNDVVFTTALGLYGQPPLYRELRNLQGRLQTNVRAQKSFHALVGADLNFRMWGRVFNLVNEWYYKHLWDVNAYELENARIRYFANNNGRAYAWGSDLRISGEFIPNAESWFSVGVLTTREDLAEDNRGFIRRPSDQRLNFGLFLQDHLPDDPSIRVYVRGLYSSGLPFGPPDNPEYRNLLTSRSYRRVDIGFRKIFTQPFGWQNLQKLSLGVEVLNLLGNNNIISYTWVQDFAANSYAVPNTLSSRFINLKLSARY